MKNPMLPQIHKPLENIRLHFLLYKTLQQLEILRYSRRHCIEDRLEDHCLKDRHKRFQQPDQVQLCLLLIVLFVAQDLPRLFLNLHKEKHCRDSSKFDLQKRFDLQTHTHPPLGQK